MTLDALRLEVPDILNEQAPSLTEVTEQLACARTLQVENALQEVLSLLFRCNRSDMTLLERQRILQSFSEAYRYYAQAYAKETCPPPLFLRLCNEMAAGFKRLLLQILQGRQPSRPHLAWCLYKAQYFLSQSLLRHYQLYQEPPPSLWRDSHLLYWIGEHQNCLDEHIAAAFLPAPSTSLRGLYQQALLLALSNPFHLAQGECGTLFAALAPLSELARLLPWDDEDENEGPTVDLTAAHPCMAFDQVPHGQPADLRRFELGALLIGLHEPAPLQTAQERELLERVRANWLGRQQRRHARSEYEGPCNLIIGLTDIHAQLLEKRPNYYATQMLDGSAGGARVLCNSDQGGHLAVGQIVLVLANSGTPTLALVRWRHQNIDGLHLGLRYLKGLPRPAWLRRSPSSQTHPALLQSTPEPGNGWHHGLWLPNGQFVEGESVWLQLTNLPNQIVVQLPPSNMLTPSVSRYPLRLA
jgi:hypothetical protein